VITRALAIVPALAGVLWLGQGAVGQMLVATQVVLSLQLPFAIWPLLRFAGNRQVMGRFAAPKPMLAVGWLLFALILAANLALVSGCEGGARPFTCAGAASRGRGVDAHAGEVPLDVARGLAQALLVFDHGDPHKAFAILAIAHARRHGDFGMGEQLLGKFQAAHAL
jgi:hypothetical protein